MSESMINTMAYAYLQIGVSGLLIIVGLWLIVWYFVKGRKETQEYKIRIAEEYARTGKIVENNTAAINNNTAVIELNTAQRADEKKCLDMITARLSKHGEQLDEIQTNQAIYMDRQVRVTNKGE